MHHHYDDIRSRIAESPVWWDEHAVPRYAPFTPDEMADIYARECALVQIACQGCGTRFLVCFSWGVTRIGVNETGTVWVKAQEPQTVESVRRLHYGDPPNAGCCPSGPTMNCNDLRVVEFWRRVSFDWQRVPELELMLAEEGG